MPSHSKKTALKRNTLSLAISFAMISPLVSAASFTIINGQTVNAIQTLGNNDTGTIEVGGSLITSGGVINASVVSLNTTDVVINNSGVISASGTTASNTIQANDSIRMTINNSGAIIGSNSIGAIFVNAIVGNDSTGMVINNSGTITGDIRVGANTILNLAGGTINGNVLGNATTSVHITGPVDVANYSAVNFSNIGSFDITSGGTLSFANNDEFNSGLFNSRPLVNAGVVNINVGTATLTGNYTQLAGGIFRTQVSNDTTYGKLEIRGGIATLPSNAKIDVNVADANFNFTSALTNGMADIIDATTLVSDGTFSVTDNSVLVDFSAVKDGNTVDLVLTAASSGTGVLAAITGSGSSAGEGAAATFDNLINNGGGSAEMDAVINELIANHSATQQAVADAVESTLPSVSGGVAQTTNLITQAFTGLVGTRQDAARGLSSGDGFMTDRHLWIKPFGGWTEQGDRQGVTGYDIDSYGLAIGMDGEISSTWNLGFALAYINSDVESNLNVGSYDIDLDSYLAKVYASKTVDETTTLKLQLGAGISDYDSKRRLFTGDIASADYDSWQLQASVALERRYAISDQAMLTPYLHADYSYVDVESYDESGAGALNLAVDSDSADSLIIGLGVKANYAASDSVTLLADIGVGYDVMTDRSRLTSSFAGGGAQFTTQGIEPDEFVYNASLGANYNLDNGTQITARYNIEGREDYTDESLSMNLRWMF